MVHRIHPEDSRVDLDWIRRQRSGRHLRFGWSSPDLDALEELSNLYLEASPEIDDQPVLLCNDCGTPLLREILTEKYIALFGSIEPYNDYKRTCFPNVTPVVASSRAAFVEMLRSLTRPAAPCAMVLPLASSVATRKAVRVLFMLVS